MKTELKYTFLSLVRLGIGHHGGACPDAVDLAEVKGLAEKQGLSAVVLDGVDKWRTVENSKEGSKNVSLQEKIFLAEWIGEVHQFYELRYEQYLQTIAQMATFYNEHGFKMMVLKGYACSLDWPKPNHRPCGDIDIWQFGQQKEADEALTAWFKGLSGSTCSPSVQEFKVDNSHHHHTVFYWGDFMVENHYDFINVHHHKSHSEFEKILKKQGKDDTHSVEVTDASTDSATKVYLPSPNLHALFLLKHLTLHFSTGEISFRQLLDWAFFVEKHGKEVGWPWVEDVLEKFGLTTIYKIFNAICVEELGFDAELFHQVHFDPELKKRVLNDILSSEYGETEPVGLLKRLLFKFRRWKANEWKHKLCYKESMWSAFWYGVWNHLLKPKSI